MKPSLPSDSRLASSGARLPLTEGYADQPYVVILPDGDWLCLVTSADGHEGSSSQGVFTLRSSDQGKTWSTPLRLEQAGSPENSYAVGLVTPSGRVYAFYNFNTENLREVKTEDGGVFERVDSLGDYVFRYSDDGGRTWSAQRHTVPVREFLCDRNNVYGGKVRFFWNVGRPCIRANGEVVIPLHKVGAMGAGFFAQSEGAFLLSKNILTESDPEKIVFETLPDGELGLSTPPGGRAQPQLSVGQGFKDNLLRVALGEDVFRKEEGPLRLREKPGTHRADFVQRNHHLAIGPDAGTSDIPEEADFPAIDVVAVAEEFANGHRVPLGRPGAPAVVRVAEDIIAERIDPFKDPAVLGLHLAQVLRVEVVKGIDATGGRHQSDRVGIFRGTCLLQAQRCAPGLALIRRTQGEDALRGGTLMSIRAGHQAKPVTVGKNHNIRLVGITLRQWKAGPRRGETGIGWKGRFHSWTLKLPAGNRPIVSI
ncbi:MAG: sialidase family protein [Verrucomicrobiota bacterium]